MTQAQAQTDAVESADLSTEARLMSTQGSGMSMDTAMETLPVVEERELFYGPGEKDGHKRFEIEGQKALIDPRTGRVFSLVTNDYRLIRHEDVIEMAEAVTAQMPEYGEPERKVWMPQDGAKMRLEYVFPEAAVTVKAGDDIAPRFGIFNSYDGSWALRGIFGAFRLICANGMTVGSKLVEYRREHHQPMNGTDDLRDMVMRGMALMNGQKEIWKGWLDRTTTSREYEDIVHGLKLTKTQTEELRAEVEVGSEVRLEEQKLTAISYWAFYNIVTQYITHKVKSQIKQQRLMGRVQRLFK